MRAARDEATEVWATLRQAEREVEAWRGKAREWERRERPRKGR